MAVRPKQSQGRFSTRVRLGDEEHSFVDEFRHLGHLMSADCQDDKDVVKQFRRQMLLAIRWSGSSHIHTERNKWYILTHLCESGYCLQINPNYQVN